MFHTCENGPLLLRNVEHADLCFFSQFKDLRHRGPSLKTPRKLPNQRRTVLRKESRLLTPVLSANDGRSAVMDDSPVGNVSAAGLRSHAIMTNIDRGLFPPESAHFKSGLMGWLLTT
jgi:hypothetical protein